MAYGGNPTPGSTDEVHFLLGDTDTAHQFLTDVECQYLIDTYGPGLLAAMYGALSLQAKFASRASVSVGDVSEQAGDLAAKFQALAGALEMRISAGALPTFGGTEVTEVANAAQDDSQVQPAFQRDEFANPRAKNPNTPFDNGGGL